MCCWRPTLLGWPIWEWQDTSPSSPKASDQPACAPWPSRHSSLSLRQRFGERILRPAAVRAGLDGLTFHGLRHAAASSLVDVGVHPRVMAARIGNGTVKTTMEIYARASYSADREAAQLLHDRFATAFAEREDGPSRRCQT